MKHKSNGGIDSETRPELKTDIISVPLKYIVVKINELSTCLMLGSDSTMR